LAERFQLSGVGLAKLRRRHGIPVPGRGYWRRVETGRRSKPLRSPVREAWPSDFVIRLPVRAIGVVRTVPTETVAARKEPPGDPRRIVVPERLPSRPHPLIQQTKQVLGARGERSRVRDQSCLDVRVGSEALPRGYRLLDTLLRELQRLGHTVAIRPPANGWGSGVTFVRIQRQEISFHLDQVDRLVRIERPNTSESLWHLADVG
jgi:hypothetical protein